MITRKIIPIALIAIISTTTAFAQYGKQERQTRHVKQERKSRTHKVDKEKFKSMKIAYMTDKLSLTPAEAQKFWPVYNQYTEKKATIYKEFRKEKKEMTSDKELTDSEVEKIVNQRIVIKQKELDLEKEYLAQFKKVLPIKKVAKLYRAEENFKKDLLRKMRAPTPPTPPSPPSSPTPPTPPTPATPK